MLTVNICDSETLQIEYCRILNLSFSIFQGCFSTLQCNVAQINILSSILRICVIMCVISYEMVHSHHPSCTLQVQKYQRHLQTWTKQAEILPAFALLILKMLMFSGNQYWFLMFLMDFNYLQICELQIVLNVETNWLSVYLITHLGQFLFFCMGCFVVELGCFLFSFFSPFFNFCFIFAISIYITHIMRYAHSQRTYLDIFDILFCYLLLKWLIKQKREIKKQVV